MPYATSVPIYDPDPDWIKRGSWDLWALDGGPVENVDQLRRLLLHLQIPVGVFKQLEVYKAHLKDKPWLKDL